MVSSMRRKNAKCCALSNIAVVRQLRVAVDRMLKYDLSRWRDVTLGAIRISVRNPVL